MVLLPPHEDSADTIDMLGMVTGRRRERNTADRVRRRSFRNNTDGKYDPRQVEALTGIPWEAEEPLYVNDRLIALHTITGGPRTIVLPKKCRLVTEVFSGRVVAENTDRFEDTLTRLAPSCTKWSSETRPTRAAIQSPKDLRSDSSSAAA